MVNGRKFKLSTTYRCDKCHKIVNVEELNSLRVNELIEVTGRKPIVSMRLCNSCTYKLRDYLYQQED